MRRAVAVLGALGAAILAWVLLAGPPPAPAPPLAAPLGAASVAAPISSAASLARWSRFVKQDRRFLARGGEAIQRDSAVEASLKWLARHQAPDGSWRAGHSGDRCGCEDRGKDGHDLEVTSLALLAFLGAGYTPQNRATYVNFVTGEVVCLGDVVRRGIQHLIDRQDAGGRLSASAYDQSLATLALSEAYGITNARAYRAPAQLAIDCLEAARGEDGWGDTETTGNVVMALKSAQISGLEVQPEAFEGAKRHLNRVVGSEGRMETAIDLICRIFIDKKKGDPHMARDSARLLRELPAPEDPDLTHWMWATLALFQFDGPSGQGWKKWNSSVVGSILDSSQRTMAHGCPSGSWDPGSDRRSIEAGRVYATAANALTLEVYYRYASVFGSSKRGGGN